jgi:aminopeptidase
LRTVKIFNKIYLLPATYQYIAAMDLRYNKLADIIVNFSIRVKQGDRVLIDAYSVPDEMIIAIMRAVKSAGGSSYPKITNPRVRREFLASGTEDDFCLHGALEEAAIRSMQCCVALRGSSNSFEYSDVPAQQQILFSKMLKPAQDFRVSKTRWVLLVWPTLAYAQAAKMSTEAFEDFFFDVCTMDYSRMEAGMTALKARMENTDKVRIIGPGTDLKFSIRGIGTTTCGGHHNIPDGEVFTAPVRDSVEGVINYNVPTTYRGQCFDNVRFEFENGRIINATAANSDETNALNNILDSDDGARYIGEFAFGFHPYILRPMNDILFDEKIAGSLHLTPGQAYDGISDNGNRSQIHWDIVLIQRPEFGGGDVFFDDELVRHNGLFVPENLKKLNPEYLLSE